MLRLVGVLLAVLAAGLLVFSHVRRAPDAPSEVSVLSGYRSLKGANKVQRLLPPAYCHLQEILVGRGEEVARGRLIGRMGMSGKAVGVSHVHLKPYPLGRLALTYPVPCGGIYRER